MPRDDRSATRVTGVSSELRSAARRGELLADRYQVISPVARHVVGRAYHAEDTTSGDRVLLHVIDRALLPTSDAVDRYLEQLRARLGRHHPALPGIRDVGLFGHRVYVVEPYPPGITLTDFLSHRRHQQSRLELGEVRAVVHRLQAALDALPRDSRHGFVDASTIWVQLDGVQLSTPFIVPALSDGAVAGILDGHPAAANFAPEVRRGTPHVTSDLYSAAVVVSESLFGETRSSVDAASEPRGIASALAALLSERPEERPRSLRPLLEALAAGRAEKTQPSDDLPKTRTVPYAAVLETEETDFPKTRTTSPDHEVTPVEAAATDAKTPSRPKPRPGGTEEIDLRDLEPVDPIPVHRIAANLNAWTRVTAKKTTSEAAETPPFAEITSVGRRPRPPLPRRPIPVPPPRVDRRVFAQPPVSRPGPPNAIPSVTIAPTAALPAPTPWAYAPSFSGVDIWAGMSPWQADTDEDTSEGRRNPHRLPRWLKSWLIVVVAMVSGALIIAGGLWMQNERRKAERERHLERRYEELRRSGQVFTPEAAARLRKEH